MTDKFQWQRRPAAQDHFAQPPASRTNLGIRDRMLHPSLSEFYSQVTTAVLAGIPPKLSRVHMDGDLIRTYGDMPSKTTCTTLHVVDSGEKLVMNRLVNA